MDIINRNMKVGEIKETLEKHLINLPYMWEIALNMVFATYGDTLEVCGFGSQAYFKAL